MNLFRKKDSSAIPPVAQKAPPSSSSSPAPRFTPQTYVPSRDAGLYDSVAYSSSRGPTTNGPSPNDPSYIDKYSRNRGVGDVYSRGGSELDRDRNELFSGYNPAKSGSGRFFDGPEYTSESQPGQETEEDVEGIKKQTRFVKQESVNSTRNALRMAREAEETARNTLQRLGDQSEKLANTERHLDVSKGHSLRADDKTNELKQLNRSIFRPVITFNKDAKRTAQEAKIQARFEEEREEREKAMMDVRETQNRLGKAISYGHSNEEELLGSRRFQSASQMAEKKEQRKRFQFDATASDDELEDELDNNLDEIGDVAKRLKGLAMGMGQEVDKQIDRIERIEGKTVGLDNRIHRNTERLKKV